MATKKVSKASVSTTNAGRRKPMSPPGGYRANRSRYGEGGKIKK